MSDREVSARPSVRIGVTGHRSFADTPSVVAALEVVLARVAPPGTDATVISSLAEGGDRLVAELVLTRTGGRLEAILPLAPDEYRADFASVDARDEFGRLLARADRVDVIVAGTPTGDSLDDDARTDAYERAGHAVVDRSDVLVALWDGRPARGRGGCAEIVQYALDQNRAVEVVLAERGEPGP